MSNAWNLRGISATLVLGLFSLGAQAAETGYYNWPALRGDVLVFASEGDLWRASPEGGAAHRLTTHAEEESHPAISPDGKWLAFNAHYDGAEEVYVMPISGGAPRQLTFEGGGAAVRGWTPDGKVLFRSWNAPGVRPRLLRTVDPEDLTVRDLPLADADLATFSDGGDQLFFTRFGLTLGRDNAILYRGGRMAQLWRFRPGSDEEAERLLPDFDAPIRHPFWWQDRLYFITDKSGADNIWSLDPANGEARQLTNFQGWQLRNPSLDGGRIVYQRGADLYRFDIESGSETRIALTLVSDREYRRTRWLDEPLAYLRGAHVGAQGKAVALSARGRVAIAFAGERRRVELAIPPEARARAAKLGPKGEAVHMILDQGENSEVWRYSAEGRGRPSQLTRDSDAHLWGLYPAPDGSRIVFDDKLGRLWSLELENGGKTLIDQNQDRWDRPFGDFTWSKGGRYLAYRSPDRQSRSRIVIHDFTSGERHTVTGGKYESFGPAFSTDGHWLYFISNRAFSAWPRSPWGDRNLGPFFDKRGKIYALQLDPEARFPFAQDDEFTPPEPEEDSEAEDSAEEETEEPEFEIVFEGLADRLWEVPVEPQNFAALAANESLLFARHWEDGTPKLVSIAIDPRAPEVTEFAEQVRRFALSADGSTLFLWLGEDEQVDLVLVPAESEAPEELELHRLRVGDWRLGIEMRSEWRQMFFDAWRLHRDFIFDPDMRGVDWEGVRSKYQAFLDRVGHRAELDDLLAQMVAELGILHSQVRGGDRPEDAESGDAAFLGATFRPHPEGMEIGLVYTGERDLPDRLGPLLQPGVDVRAGDVLTALDGRPVSSQRELFAALQHKAGQQVRLDLRRGAAERQSLVTPVDKRALHGLRYRHWVEQKRETVAAATDGRIGYLHLRAMGGSDIESFARDYYALTGKEGLVIDVRGNRGGNIDSWILGILLRRVWAFWQWRPDSQPDVNMQQTFRGHLAVLIDEKTYSDGESFSAGIKALELACVFGTRTAGAGIWLSNRNRLTDGGVARIAQFPVFGLDGRWLIEGRGVSPHREIVNPPHATYKGSDAQLEAAIRYLEDKLASDPIPALTTRPLPRLGEYGSDVAPNPARRPLDC